jgi:acetyl esterase/lipase
MTAAASTTAQDHVIDGPHGGLRVRVYRPADQSSIAGLVWVHGGGFAYGDIDMPEAHWVASSLATMGVAMISVDYQLAPPLEDVPDDATERTGLGVRFPVASEEVTAAFRWATAHSAELGVVPERWSLGGGSAGGNLSAGAALRLRDEGGPQPCSLVLVYPVLHRELPPHRTELAAKVAALPPEDVFTAEEAMAMNLNYVGNESLLDSPYAFPGGHDLEGLPPTFILNSDSDSLRSSGELFASELAAAGVDVFVMRETGSRHGHLNQPDNPLAQRSLDRIRAWLHSQH